MLFDIWSKLRFGLSAIKMWFRLIYNMWIVRTQGEKAGYNHAFAVAKDHVAEILRISRMNLTIEGVENIPEEPVVFMGNHQSYMDIYVALSALTRPVYLIGKLEIKKMPILGRLAKAMHGLLLDRDNAREGLKVILAAIDGIKKDGYDVFIYPEGTRSKSLVMGEFHKGSFKIAQKSGAPIVPMVANNTYKVFEEHYRVQPDVDVYMGFLPPIHMDQLTKEEQKNIDAYVKERIQAKLDELNATP